MKKELSVMKTITKMPKIDESDESDMETVTNIAPKEEIVMIKQEESVMKTVMNTKMVMNIPKKEESVMKTVLNTKMLMNIPKKDECCDKKARKCDE